VEDSLFCCLFHVLSFLKIKWFAENVFSTQYVVYTYHWGLPISSCHIVSTVWLLISIYAAYTTRTLMSSGLVFLYCRSNPNSVICYYLRTRCYIQYSHVHFNKHISCALACTVHEFAFFRKTKSRNNKKNRTEKNRMIPEYS
jgi:hypothetical protein